MLLSKITGWGYDEVMSMDLETLNFWIKQAEKFLRKQNEN